MPPQRGGVIVESGQGKIDGCGGHGRAANFTG
jgi:hypothetical protein